jgi:hypothetical protein
VGDIGGKDFDDMKSVGDQSDTETVWEEDYDDDEDFEGDDVSEMGDDDGLITMLRREATTKPLVTKKIGMVMERTMAMRWIMQTTTRMMMMMMIPRVAPESAVVTPRARTLVLSLLFSLCLTRINVFAT